MTSPDPVFELIKTLGSFAGWVSAGFLFFDRLIKGRPILTIVTEAPPPGELERDIALRVINTSDAPIWIQSLGFHPAVYWPALSDSTAAVVAAALQRRVTEVIEPRGERTFPLVR